MDSLLTLKGRGGGGAVGFFTANPAICNADLLNEGNGAEARFAWELRLPAKAAPGARTARALPARSARPCCPRLSVPGPGVSAARPGSRCVRSPARECPQPGPAGSRTPGAAHRERALRPRRGGSRCAFPRKQSWTRAIDSSSPPLPRRETYSFNLHWLFWGLRNQETQAAGEQFP